MTADSLHAEIVRLREQDRLSFRQIAAKVGRSKSQVQRIYAGVRSGRIGASPASGTGRTPRSGGPKPPPTDLDELAQRWSRLVASLPGPFHTDAARLARKWLATAEEAADTARMLLRQATAKDLRAVNGTAKVFLEGARLLRGEPTVVAVAPEVERGPKALDDEEALAARLQRIQERCAALGFRLVEADSPARSAHLRLPPGSGNG